MYLSMIIYWEIARLMCFFDKISVKEKEQILPRSFDDYVVTVDEHMPAGVTFIQKL